MDDYLEFEQPLADLDEKINQLQQQSDHSAESAEQVRELQRNLSELTRETYGNLTPWQTVQVARHKNLSLIHI